MVHWWPLLRVLHGITTMVTAIPGASLPLYVPSRGPSLNLDHRHFTCAGGFGLLQTVGRSLATRVRTGLGLGDSATTFAWSRSDAKLRCMGANILTRSATALPSGALQKRR